MMARAGVRHESGATGPSALETGIATDSEAHIQEEDWLRDSETELVGDR
jgi:hypothetical protein